MIVETPKQTGKSKVSEEDSPQSHDSGETDLTVESNSTFSTGSNELGATMTPTLEEQQEGLPEEIKSKTYPSDLAAAEDELFEDLKKHSLLDSDKVIVINQDGKAVWAMPTVFHQDALQKLLRIINKHSDQDPLLAQADIPLLIDKKKGKYRHPDVAIWGQSRLEAEDEDGEFDRKYISIDGFPGENSMNPHAIIEFSWTNKIEMEIWKLQEQVAGHIHALGVVRLGFLIKAKPAEGAKFPTVLDRNVPLSGFDVYRFRSGETTTLPDPILEYRVGSEEAETMAIEISGTDLGCSNQADGISIPLSAIRKSCEKSGLVFHAEATVQATHRPTTAD